MTTENRIDSYFKTLHTPCQHCGFTWHKHMPQCPNYSSLDWDRCQQGHWWILRSSNPDELLRYEYECNICNLRPVFMTHEMSQDYRKTHPMCLRGEHYYIAPSCSMSCCWNGYETCMCGARRLLICRYGLNPDAEGADTRNSDTRFP